MANVASLASDALTAGNGILRLAPTWVPRSFLQPGRRLKLHPNDYYALGMNRGGIDERWFGSTTEAANENRNEDEGLSYCVYNDERFQLRDVVAELKDQVIGEHIWNTFRSGPCIRSSSTIWVQSPTTCTKMPNRRRWWDRKESRKAITSRLR